MYNFLKFLILSFITLSCVESSEREIPFYDNSKVPIIEGILNNKKAYFIVDSGASISILDINQSKEYSFDCLDLENTVVGFGGKSTYYTLSNVNVDLKLIPTITEFKGNDLKLLVKIIDKHSHVKIVGILGSDIFKKNGIQINYSTNSIKY
jgi:hypothetical protein